MQPPKLTVQHSSSLKMVWENAFSTEFKHSDIKVNNKTAIREKDTISGEFKFLPVCAMGATVLAIPSSDITYRCSVKVTNANGYSAIYLGVAM
jgi:hypothetical protein